MMGAVSACQCGFRYDDVPVEALGHRLTGAIDEFCHELETAPEPVARRRPGPAVWSPLEYACHLRDVLITQRERVVRALVEESPAFPPMHRDERAELTRYAAEARDRVVIQLRIAAEMISWTLASLDDRQWERPCIYNFPEVASRTVGWVGQHTLHEAVHHLADVRPILHGGASRRDDHAERPITLMTSEEDNINPAGPLAKKVKPSTAPRGGSVGRPLERG